MEKLFYDFSETSGKIKPMNCVNNGPTDPGVRKVKTNFEYYKAAKFPYARNHDASFYTPYGGGGEHLVDVHRIFKNFDADENNPESYIFEPTDQYLQTTLDAGTKIFYRLGASIEHRYKYGTRVPKDMAKWARICEHIIMHYTEGWANGFHYDIEYWEIWNEPDCLNADGSNPCWQGTWDEFIDLYEISAKHLKSRFPHLKIGGPAFATPEPYEFKDQFLKAVKDRNIPFDFYSYHCYGKHVDEITDRIYSAQKELDTYGLSGTPTILNEWNYVRGWVADDWDYSLKTEKGLKGASFVAGAMCEGQANPLDMLMYYDARPCAMNGIFEAGTFLPLKPYYAFVLFNNLAELGNYVKCDSKIKNVYSCAAKDGDSAGIMLTYFDENDDGFHKDMPISDKEKEVCIEIKNPTASKKFRIEYYVTDEEHSNELIKEEILDADTAQIKLNMSIFALYYIKIVPAE